MTKRGSTNVVAMGDGQRRGAPTTTAVGLIERPTEIGGTRFAAMKPETLAATLASAASGDLENWFDLVDKMLESDAHLASLIETRTRLLVGSPWEMETGCAKPGEAELAKEGAAFCKEQIQSVPGVERLFSDLNHGLFTGLSAQEHNWEWQDRTWVSFPEWRAPRLFRYGPDWCVQVKDRDRKWIDVPFGKFVVHTPRTKAGYPTRAALLRTVAWEWLFKFWATFFWTSGAERLGNPPMVGNVGKSTDRRTKNEMRQNLERLSSGQAIILEKDTTIEFPDSGFSGSANVWEQLVKNFDAAESKAIIGSTLNVEVGETGGAYAAADSQAATTVRPRIISDGYILGGTLARDWCARILEYNAHVFGGRVPPTPTPVWSPDVGKPKPSDALVNHLVGTGSVTRNQLLAMAGLPELTGPEGSALVSPLAKAPGAPMSSRTPEVTTSDPTPPLGGAGPERPFSRRPRRSQLTLPLTSPTCSRSRGATNPLRAVLSDTSDDPPSSR